jgi:hypothetical protein
MESSMSATTVRARHSREKGAASAAETSGHAWQQLWFGLTRTEWTTLAIVPVEAGAPAIGVARALAEAGQQYQSESVVVIDAGHIAPNDVAGVLQSFDDRGATHRRVIVAVGSPLDNATAIPIVRAVDVAVLLVQVGRSGVSRARRSMASIGGNRFAGSIAIAG